MPVSRAPLVLLVLIVPAVASAQGREALARAEEAYLRVDFQATIENASQALESGSMSAADLVRVYQLVGISAAALEDEDRSREAYIRMLALDPSREVDRNLAPRLRSPFLEARGYWTGRSDRLEADVRFDDDERTLEIALSDPLSMAQLVVIWARPERTARWQQVRRPAAPSITVELEGSGSRVEYAVAVLDVHGNRLIELGDPASPRSVGEAALEPSTEDGRDEAGGSVLASPIFWTVAGALLLAGGIGGYLLLSNGEPGVRTAVTIGVQ